MKIILSAVLGFIMLSACADRSTPFLEFEENPSEPRKKQDFDEVGANFNRGVDILFVVDNSGSMKEVQENLARNVENFTRAFTASNFVDYHIGVITTDATYGRSGNLVGTPRFVDPNTPYGMEKLRANLKVGLNGSTKEEMFRPIKDALTEPLMSGHNANFYRPAAMLVVILITDADDQGQMSPADLYEFLLKLKRQSVSHLLMAGAISHRGSDCGQDGGDPVKLEELLSMSNGLLYSLCDPSFGLKLAELGVEVWTRFARAPLDQLPEPSTIEVWHGKDEIPNHPDKGWTYEPSTNSLVFGRDIEIDDSDGLKSIEIFYRPARRPTRQ